MKDIDFVKAARQSSRRGRKPSLLVIHYTAGRLEETSVAKYFSKPWARASAHLVTGRSGETIQCVGFDRSAWHAGRSKANGVIHGSSVNRESIGWEFCNAGHATSRVPIEERMHIRHDNPRSRSNAWEAFGVAQMQRANHLLAQLLTEVPTLEYICGHDDVAPGRKLDPGPAFPWNSLLCGLGTRLMRCRWDYNRKEMMVDV